MGLNCVVREGTEQFPRLPLYLAVHFALGWSQKHGNGGDLVRRFITVPYPIPINKIPGDPHLNVNHTFVKRPARLWVTQSEQVHNKNH